MSDPVILFRGLVGVVEEVGVKVKKEFTNLDELWEILSPSKIVKTHKKSAGVVKRVSKGTGKN
jgi:hypothetical protein